MTLLSRILAIAFLLFFVSPALAQWSTTEFMALPIEDNQSSTTAANSNFNGYAENGSWSGARTDFSFDAWNDTISVEAEQMLASVFKGASYDSKRLAEAGTKAPNLSEYMIPPDGTKRIPVYWETFNGQGGMAAWSCTERRISVNNDVNSIDALAQRWQGNGPKNNPQYVVNAVTATLMHEVVHSIQAAADDRWDCITGGTGSGTSSSSWIGEATATGIANYLLSKRVPNLGRDYDWARLERLYAKPLYDVNEKYSSQSFFVYLLEGTEVGGRSDLSLAVDILTKFTRRAAKTRDGTLALLASIVEDHASTESHKRPFALVLAEFLTEYASYSDRYGIEEPQWISRGFSDCIDVKLTPGSVDTVAFPVLANSGRCIRVDWNGFAQPVALQFFLEGSGIERGSLHMGEASYRSGSNWRNCYEVTSRIDKRLANHADKKCILRRGVELIDGRGRSYGSVAGWTSDFNLSASGYSYFILTNASEDITTSSDIDVTLTVGSAMVRETGGAALPARMTSDLPVKNGRTSMDSRVHAIAAGPGRVLFDGRSIFGDGIGVGFLDGVSGAAEVDAGGSIVRTGDYMIMLVKDKQGVPNQASIIREPRANGGKMITTLSTNQTGRIGRCGYSGGARLENLSTSDNKLRFTVSGDLFDFSPDVMMAMAGRDLCEIAAATHVEFKSIEVSLPFPEVYDGSVEITRAYPPMQDIYDELEFRSGPSFGGIETSRSLVLGDGAPNDDETDQVEGTGSESSRPVGGNSTSSVEQCTCHCPNIVSPTTGSCFNQCDVVLQICPDPSSTEAIAADSSRYGDILQNRNLADSVRDMLLSDFATMSGDTRSQLIREALWD